MGISGYEALVMCTVSPFFLGIKPIRYIATRYVWFFHLLSLSGLLAFLAKTPVNRLFAVAFGLSMSCLAWSATFLGERSQPHRLEGRITAFAIGLIASSIAKYAFCTNNPIWPIMH